MDHNDTTHCLCCKQPLPPNTEPPAIFGHGGFPAPEPDDVLENSGSVDALLGQIETLFHTIFVMWRFETDHHGEMSYESASHLTTLGAELAQEALRHSKRLRDAGLIWEQRAPIELPVVEWEALGKHALFKG